MFLRATVQVLGDSPNRVEWPCAEAWNKEVSRYKVFSSIPAGSFFHRMSDGLLRNRLQKSSAQRDDTDGVDFASGKCYFSEAGGKMIPKVIIGVLLGGAAGFALSYITRAIGSA